MSEPDGEGTHVADHRGNAESSRKCQCTGGESRRSFQPLGRSVQLEFSAKVYPESTPPFPVLAAARRLRLIQPLDTPRGAPNPRLPHMRYVLVQPVIVGVINSVPPRHNRMPRLLLGPQVLPAPKGPPVLGEHHPYIRAARHTRRQLVHTLHSPLVEAKAGVGCHGCPSLRQEARRLVPAQEGGTLQGTVHVDAVAAGVPEGDDALEEEPPRHDLGDAARGDYDVAAPAVGVVRHHEVPQVGIISRGGLAGVLQRELDVVVVEVIVRPGPVVGVVGAAACIGAVVPRVSRAAWRVLVVYAVEPAAAEAGEVVGEDVR